MPRLFRFSQLGILGLLIATLLVVSACRGQPSLPSAATRTPTRAATARLATPGVATAAAGTTAVGPAPAIKTTPAAPGTVAATGAAPVSTGAARATGAAPVSTVAPGTTAAAASPTKAPVAAPTTAPGVPSTPAASGTRVSIPIVTAPGTGPCAAFDSALQVSASATQVKVDQPVTVTAKLINNGCGTLAWPQYYVNVYSGSGFGAVLQPWRPAATSHAVGVKQGQADTAVWVLQATTPGQADVTVSVVFQTQATAGAAGPWNGTSAKPVRITVTR